MAPEKPIYVTLARILRPQGRRGEVAAEILTDYPDRLTKLTSVVLWDGKSAPHRIAVRGCWLSRSRRPQAIFHFEGLNTIEDAKRLAGLEIQVPLEERVVLPRGRYYITDLIGCDVREMDGSSLGTVRDVQLTGEEIPGTPLLVVDSRQGELLIPLAEEICTEIDVAARRIEVALPPGLRELNQK